MFFQQNLDFINSLNNPVFALMFFILTIWTLIWKGIAMWQAARNNHKWWFLAILIINTFGILEIVYVFFFSKNKETN